MELFDGVSPVEQMLVAKADVMKLPIGGSMELLPLCNMNCKMCYIRQSREEMESQGRMLTCDEWLAIAESAKRAGVLFLLLTGGEPLLFPEFKRLYTTLTDMGFVLTINTNGTLIDEEWAALFAKRPCRRMNITLYGKDDETYRALCRNPQGFTQVQKAVKLLKERKVPFRFNFTCTPYNVEQLPELYEFARSIDVPMAYSTHIFPPVRKGADVETIERLTPQECGRAYLAGVRSGNPNIPIEEIARATLDKLKQPIRNCASGNVCRAGYSGFWVNWKGELLPCGMFNEPKANLLEESFSDAWKEISQTFRGHPVCRECEICKKRNLCRVCAASCYTETGAVDGKPQYLCESTDEMIRLLLQYVSEEERNEYLMLLEE